MKWLLIVLISMVVMAGCTQQQRSDSVVSNSDKNDANSIRLTQDERAQAHIRVDSAKVRDLPLRIEIAATVQPDETLTMPVSSLVSGAADDVLVRLGDTVSKGQVLATVRSDQIGSIEADFLQRLLDLRATNKQDLLAGQAEIDQLTTKVDFLTKQTNRKKYLHDNKIGSQAELEASRSDLNQAQSALKAAKAKYAAQKEAAESKEKSLFISTVERLRLFGIPGSEVYRVAEQKTVQSIFQIRAPKTGLVTSRDIDPGETIDANRALFVITDLSRVWFIGQIFEKDIRRLSVGMPVICSVESYPGEKFHGHLEYLGSKLDPQTRTLPIRASVVNGGKRLRPDMFGLVLVTYGHAETLTVPKEALQTIGEAQVVFVQRKADSFERRMVKVGREVDNYVEILSGVSPGDQIVTRGSIDLLGKELQALKQD